MPQGVVVPSDKPGMCVASSQLRFLGNAKEESSNTQFLAHLQASGWLSFRDVLRQELH